jgi:hypothetical protein
MKYDNERENSNNYLLINDLFNLSKNLDELFDHDELKDKGILYIKGIVGVSILFTIIGQLFLIFLNLFMKDFGKYQFYNLLSSPFYVLIYIGLRYSPRVLFSCSGFTLAYKSLKFNEKEPKYSLFKFFFRQLYKYFILILFVFFLRYSLYGIISLLEVRPMWKALDELELKRPTELNILLLKIFNLGVFSDVKNFFSSNDGSNFSHDLFDYLWMPFNEIFFFIFGIILIFLGVKIKLRIDYIILFLIISLMASKILIYFLYYKKSDIYTTLYYYIFGHGRLMLNPLYNLNYFLIGMYFGLINYSI